MDHAYVICQPAERLTRPLTAASALERGCGVSEMLTAKQVMARLKLGRTTVYGADEVDEWMTATAPVHRHVCTGLERSA